MTRLIDVDALPSGRVEWDDILEAPTVEAVPVIRCKDCKWQMSEWLAVNHKPVLNHYCSYHDYTDDLGYDDDFCSKAERKEYETD